MWTVKDSKIGKVVSTSDPQATAAVAKSTSPRGRREKPAKPTKASAAAAAPRAAAARKRKATDDAAADTGHPLKVTAAAAPTASSAIVSSNPQKKQKKNAKAGKKHKPATTTTALTPVQVDFNAIPWAEVQPGDGFLMGDDQAPGGFLSLEEIDGVDVEYEVTGGGKMISFKKVKDHEIKGKPASNEAPLSDMDMSSFVHIDDFVEGEQGLDGWNTEDEEDAIEMDADSAQDEQEEGEEEEEAEAALLTLATHKDALPHNPGAKILKGAAVVNGGAPMPSPHTPADESDSNFDVSAWDSLNLVPELMKGLQAQRFSAPSEIQAKTLPAAMGGTRDVIGAAQTGSGKTLAFGLPILQSIAQRTVVTKDPGLHALILTPTRELAMQVTDHLQNTAKFMSVRIVSIVGGMSIPKQKRQLLMKPDILVATPGRLWELASEDENLLAKLRNIKFLAIDEADRMLEAGHFKDLDSILNAISLNRADKPANLVRRTFIFSATLVHDPRMKQKLKSKPFKKGKGGGGPSMENLLKRLEFQDKNPLYVNCLPDQVTADNLLETRIECLHTDKDAFLYYILIRYPGRTIVFVNSIDAIRRLVPVLTHMRIKAFGLHAEMQQRQRLKNLDRFKESTSSVLIASDVAARGLDIPHIEHVVHYQLPRSADLYVHRSGRTARASAEGVSVMMISPQEVGMYKKICSVLGKTEGVPEFPVDRSLLSGIKTRMSLAKKIDEIEHRKQKKAHEKNWFMKAAEEMDVELDTDFIDSRLTGGEQDTERSKTIAKDQQMKVQALKAELNQLLAQDMVPKGISGNYLTSNVDDGLAGVLIKAGATKSKMPTQGTTSASQEIRSQQKPKPKSKQKQ
ncbi:ATP-dependent RNA helicase [Geranomyces michiganensis]|nr:ATP-dependent RNA helicase [Geranomyces michiganensis]